MRVLSMVAVLLAGMPAAVPADTGVHAAAAAPDDYWVAGGDQTGRRLLAFDPAVTDWNSSAAVKWSWEPSVAPGGFSADEVSAFGLIAGFKLRTRPSGAQSVVVAAGGSRGIAAIVSYPAGVRQWARILPGNLHAAELLPDGNIAVAASTGGWVRVYASSQGPHAATYAEFKLTDAHAALWDPAIRRLWVIGQDPASGQHILTALAVEGTPARPSLREDRQRRAVLPTGGGHDVYGHATDTGKLWLTTGSAAYLYDKATKTFDGDLPGGAGRSAVKSIGAQPSGQIVQTRPDAVKTPPGACTDSTWCTDTVDFFAPAMTRRRTGAAFYKARVWSPHYGVADQSLRGTVWDRTRSTSGAWAPDAARIDANGAVSDVAVAALPDGSLRVLTLVPGSGVWERGRSSSGEWDERAVKIDDNGSISRIAAAALPDGSLHVQTLVPGAGVWDRMRSAGGQWASSVRIDDNGSVSEVSAAGLPDGTLQVQTVVPGAGVWNRSRGAGGAWASSVKIDANGSVSAVSGAALPDGTLQVQTVVPGSGVWNRSRSAAGAWAGAAVKADGNASVLASSAAALEDGTLHLFTLPDIS
ncbi:hypothetical protein E1295_09265 [Nonomuraea mesophila]|uniref:WD40 repeat domain-containing protein n=1 Tax=Nonomuraea mesophila TaxID=2530382 RepID=A0A4R5FTN4_9ACTN|nr:DUF6528 family protein [Nonomuraea mesophila]TDE57015.1 hypothetical protein E1295_09265 [Nonomuraea mesophila]